MCSKLNCAFPDTGQGINPGAWAWLQCSSMRPGFEVGLAAKEVGLAAKEDVFELAFVAYRVSDGIRDKKLAEELWSCCVGDACDEAAFTNFRDTINGMFIDHRGRGKRAHAQP